MRLAGPVYPDARPPAPRPRLRHVDPAASWRCWARCRPGHVAVYQTNDRTSAHLGELSVTSLASRGCAGAVIDGGARDADYILREDFPVFARYVTPQDCVPRWELLAHGDVTIVVGGVRVAPGDWIVGDRDGLVIVPGDERRGDPRRGRGEGRHRERDPRRGARRNAPARGLRAVRDVLTTAAHAKTSGWGPDCRGLTGPEHSIDDPTSIPIAT